MTNKTSRSAFDLKGRGILGGLVSSPLTSDVEAAQLNEDAAAKWIPVGQIRPGKYQPRRYFSQESITSLAQSFKAQGFRGAINVRPQQGDTYEIVAGERRWRAAKEAGLNEVRCIIDDYSDEEALQFALVENLQREDLSKLEETEGILQLIETKLGIATEDAIYVIRTEGHSDKYARSDVAPSVELQKIEALLSYFNIELQTFRTKNLRTLTLPEDLKAAHLQDGLSYSAALELNKIKDDNQRATLLAAAIQDGLSFREIKRRVKDWNPQSMQLSESASVNHTAAASQNESVADLQAQFGAKTTQLRKKRIWQRINADAKLRKKAERINTMIDELLTAVGQDSSSSSGD